MIFNTREYRPRYTVADNLDTVTELTRLALDLDAIVQELLEGGTIENTITSRCGVVNDKLVLCRGLGGGLVLQ